MRIPTDWYGVNGRRGEGAFAIRFRAEARPVLGATWLGSMPCAVSSATPPNYQEHASSTALSCTGGRCKFRPCTSCSGPTPTVYRVRWTLRAPHRCSSTWVRHPPFLRRHCLPLFRERRWTFWLSFCASILQASPNWRSRRVGRPQHGVTGLSWSRAEVNGARYGGMPNDRWREPRSRE